MEKNQDRPARGRGVVAGSRGRAWPLILAAVLSPTAADTRLYGFEDGSPQLWELSDQPGEQAAVGALSATSDDAYEGNHALALDLSLDPDDPDRLAAVAVVMHPAEMTGRSLSARVRCDPEVMGSVDAPSGLQLFVKDQDSRSQYSAWNDLSGSGQWRTLSLVPNAAGDGAAHTDSGFDPRLVIQVGIKVALNHGPAIAVAGRCLIDAVVAPIEPMTVPPSDHLFTFDELDPDHYDEKRFGYGPYWRIDPG